MEIRPAFCGILPSSEVLNPRWDQLTKGPRIEGWTAILHGDHGGPGWSFWISPISHDLIMNLTLYCRNEDLVTRDEIASDSYSICSRIRIESSKYPRSAGAKMPENDSR